jgi:hypothetical protein
MFKNVKIIVLYQNFGGHKGCIESSALKNRLGGVYGGVGEDFAVATLIFSLPLNIIYIIGTCPLSFRWIILVGLVGQS